MILKVHDRDMVHGINILDWNFKPIRLSLQFNLTNFIVKNLTKFAERDLTSIDVKLKGLIREYEKADPKIIWWQNDFDKIDDLISLIDKASTYVPGDPEFYKIDSLLGSISKSLSIVKDLTVNGENLDATEYLNYFPANKDFLEKQLKADTKEIEFKID